MRALMFVFSLVWFLIGCVVFVTGKSAAHEILGAVYMVVAAVLFVGAAIVGRLDALTASLRHLPTDSSRSQDAAPMDRSQILQGPDYPPPHA